MKILADTVSIVMVFLLPVILGAVFFRILFMGGVPIWYLCVHGFFFVCSLGNAVYFVAIGLIRAVKKAILREEAKGGLK